MCYKSESVKLDLYKSALLKFVIANFDFEKSHSLPEIFLKLTSLKLELRKVHLSSFASSKFDSWKLESLKLLPSKLACMKITSIPVTPEKSQFHMIAFVRFK